MLIGDDTCSAFNGAPCAIAVAPRDYAVADRPLTRIGVGYDDGPESRRALAAARRIAARTGATITALWVLSLDDVRHQAPLPADWPSATAALIDQAQRTLDAIEGVEGEVVDGGPREELTKLADRVDLLIVGSRGYGPVGSVFHGSVSSYLERHAASALLVLPRDLDESPSSGAPSAQEHATTTVTGTG